MSDEKRANNSVTDDSVTPISDSTEAKKSTSKKQLKDAKEKKKNRKLRSLLQNYFMSRRRFFKMVESKMDRLKWFTASNG